MSVARRARVRDGVLVALGLLVLVAAGSSLRTPVAAAARPPAPPVRLAPGPIRPAPRPAPPPTRSRPAPARSTGTPVWITVASVGISESVRPDTPSDGVLEPPPGQVVWDSQTPVPGRPGGALIVGHDEWDGPSDFWNLDEIHVGAPVLVRMSGGEVLRFVVTGAKSELKTAAQDDRSIWLPSRAHDELIVVTCDKHSPVVDGHHLANFIVYAALR